MARSKGGGDFDPSATLPANFGISTTFFVRRFFTSGSFFLSHYLAPCSRMLFRGFPGFSPKFFRGSPLPVGSGSAYSRGLSSPPFNNTNLISYKLYMCFFLKQFLLLNLRTAFARRLRGCKLQQATVCLTIKIFQNFRVGINPNAKVTGTSTLPLLIRRTSESRPLSSSAVFSRRDLFPTVAASRPSPKAFIRGLPWFFA